ncbi:hypothetical protein C5745_19365 [Sphingobacterium haloxyli]|uniref:Sugar-binding protein n=2 Tax=Sphingobacterium haloxyli TaxID=2100533 RepID=A0A2S9IVI3_9SPHI|nr:hypothetical protein C5745_19365 [Sphingobacterium haloxyli]
MNNENDLVIPPSPNASSITAYGNLIVGESTGIPEVSVPIYSWSNGYFPQGLDVSLAYFAGGIQVDQISSNIGMGWSLNAGGVISRVVRGTYDESEGNGSLYNSGNNVMPASQEEGNGPLDYSLNNRYFQRIDANMVDGQHDIFTYNFMGFSGQFVLGKNNDVLIMDKSHLKIDKTITRIDGDLKIVGFRVVDEKGYTYQFNDFELTRVSLTGVPLPHTSAWYLSSVTDPTGNCTITFEYENTYDYEYNASSYSYEAYPVKIQAVGVVDNTVVSNGTIERRNGVHAYQVNGKRLKKIVLPNTVTIDFQYSTSVRGDLHASSTNGLLQHIFIKTNDDTVSYHLGHEYLIGTGKARPALVSVQKYNAAGEAESRPYTFQYYKPSLFPAPLSRQKDHWGYANANTGVLIPEEYIMAEGGGNYAPYRKLTGGNRRTDPEWVKYGSLLQMSYPTGGYTIFDFEPNTAVDEWLNKVVVDAVTDPYVNYSNNISINSNANPSAKYSFVYNGSSDGNLTLEFHINPWLSGCSNCGIRFELVGSNGSLVRSYMHSFPSPNANVQVATMNIGAVNKGTYFDLNIYVVGIQNYHDYMVINRRELDRSIPIEPVVRPDRELYVGGLRLREIQDYSSSGELVSTREYEYLLEDGETSSGTLGFRPTYSYLVDYGAEYFTSGGSGYMEGLETDKFIVRNTSSFQEMPLVNGMPVTYSRVTEKHVDAHHSTGTIVKYFSSFKNKPILFSEEPPFLPLDYSKGYYGNLLKRQVYDANENLIEETVNEYETFLDFYLDDTGRKENFRSIVISPAIFIRPPLQSGSSLEDRRFKILTSRPVLYYRMRNYYPSYPFRRGLKKSIKRSIVNGGQSVVETTEYNYDRIFNKVKEINYVISDGAVRKTKYSYPFDNSTGTTQSGMLMRNMLDFVTEEQESVNEMNVYQKRTTYDYWQNSYYAPIDIEEKYHGGPAKKISEFVSYSAGMPREIKTSGGLMITYLWGYKHQYPVAKIENATYAEVFAVLGQATINSLNAANVSDATITNAMVKLRNDPKMTGAQVTSYTYKPLVGMTSMTDPRGITEYYQYDGFQRLKDVLDFDKNVLRNYQYHYRP